MHRFLPSLVLVLPCLSGCGTVAETGRSQLLWFSEPQMRTMALKAYEEETGKYPVITKGPQAEMVQRLGRRIATASGRNYEWEFKLLDAPDSVNAFCLPGGKIAVFTGVLPVTKNEDGLAVVIGHEVAHATLQHGNERISQPTIKRIIGKPIEFVTNVWGRLAPRSRRAVMDGLGLGFIIGKALPYSQEHESEADEIGLRYLKKAGFDVEEAPKFWRRMAVAAPEGVSDSLSTHPGAERRAKRLEELIRSMETRQPR